VVMLELPVGYRVLCGVSCLLRWAVGWWWVGSGRDWFVRLTRIRGVITLCGFMVPIRLGLLSPFRLAWIIFRVFRVKFTGSLGLAAVSVISV